jgi:hypothetical protein
MTCHACGATLSDGARYCHKCGASTQARATGWRVGLPWGIAGLAVGALIGVLAMRGTGGAAGSAAPDTPVAPFAGGGTTGGGAPDISQMSPEERAQRLFDRVMRLDEAGKTDSVQFFLPMALGAYAQLPALDLDAHYDIGVLQLAGGNAAGVLAEADTILRAVPTHLYGLMLRAQGLALRGDSAAARRASAAFLANERAERARQRPEYAEHANALDEFHTEALNTTRATRGR